ncbi:hypothetical protein evm_007635 [Chilo suppressalis]|nr:hypothetical protein evm_007635 [Chilo suppressalis]
MDILFVDNGRQDEIDTFYEACQRHRDFYRGYPKAYHPLLYFTEPTYCGQCPPDMTPVNWWVAKDRRCRQEPRTDDLGEQSQTAGGERAVSLGIADALPETTRTPINVPTAEAQAFPMDGIGRLGHDPPRGPSAYWWVLTTADAAGTNGLTCLPKHRGARDSNFWSPIQRPTTAKGA